MVSISSRNLIDDECSHESTGRWGYSTRTSKISNERTNRDGRAAECDAESGADLIDLGLTFFHASCSYRHTVCSK